MKTWRIRLLGYGGRTLGLSLVSARSRSDAESLARVEFIQFGSTAMGFIVESV